MPLLDAKFAFLEDAFMPQAAERRLRRVAAIAHIPDFQEAALRGRVDITRFLKVRNTRECREFRAWLAASDGMATNEIEARIASVRGRLGDFLQSMGGRTLRLLASTGVGSIPGVGPVAGAVVGALDSFLLDRMFPASGPITFLTRLLPSAFAKNRT